jgi:hypothetical protein
LCDGCAFERVHVHLCRGTLQGMPDDRLIPVVEEEARCSAHGDFDGQPPRPRFSKGVSCRTTTYRAAPYLRRLLDRWGWALFGVRREKATSNACLCSSRGRKGRSTRSGKLNGWRARFFLHRRAGGERAGGTSNIPGLCVVIRGALMLR